VPEQCLTLLRSSVSQVSVTETVRRDEEPPAGLRTLRPMPGQPFDEGRDATRRTRLANERTYLAWWRTGLTALAVSFAAGKLLPELTKGTKWPYEVIGVAFAVVGVGFIVQAYRRQREVEEALERGEWAAFDTGSALAFAAVGSALGLGTIALLIWNP
jgi:inner membrane protein YidH